MSEPTAACGSFLDSLARFLPLDVRTAFAEPERRPIRVETVLPGVVPAAGAAPARVVVELEPATRRSRRLDASIRHATDGLARESRPLFPGADRAHDPFGLANFMIVELDCPRAAIGPHGHDVAYRLMEMSGVRRAQYEGAYLKFAPLGAVLGGGTPPQDRDWALKTVRLPQATQLPGFVPGTGIVVGHPDTGWTMHPELDQAALDLGLQWNTLNNTNDGLDPQSFILFNGHGTATGGQIVSSPVATLNGIAPAARLIPIRCVESVVLILDTELSEAVWYAAQNGAHVLSISLGGYPSGHLQAVLADAVHQRNMICCASAGNVVPWVVYPAAYPDCIAVAGTTPSDRPWKNSSWGPEVALSAPAHLVWVADFDQNRQPIAGAGSGTSFSAPPVAAAAALWLATHGRQALLAQYAGAAPLQTVYRSLVTQTARNPGVFQTPGRPGEDVDASVGYTWDTTRYGAGILDVHALLSAPLPSAAAFGGIAPAPSPSWSDVIASLFPDVAPDDVRRGLGTLFATTAEDAEERLERYGPELAQLAMGDVALHRALADVLAREAAREEVAVALERLLGLREAPAGDELARALTRLREPLPPRPEAISEIRGGMSAELRAAVSRLSGS